MYERRLPVGWIRPARSGCSAARGAAWKTAIHAANAAAARRAPARTTRRCGRCEIDGRAFTWRPLDVPIRGPAVRGRGRDHRDDRPLMAGDAAHLVMAGC